MTKDELPKSKPKDPLWVISTIISRLFEPVVVLAVLTIFAVLRSGMNQTQMTQFGIIFVTVMLLPPVLLMVWAIKTKRVSNWDVSKRHERIMPLVVLVFFLIADELIVRWFGNYFLNQIFMIYLLWSIGFFMVTLFYKISAHAGIVTLGALLFLDWTNWQYTWALVAIPLVALSRLYRKDHTQGQVLSGIIYSTIIVSIALSLG